jgi:hypothetical protein
VEFFKKNYSEKFSLIDLYKNLIRSLRLMQTYTRILIFVFVVAFFVLFGVIYYLDNPLDTASYSISSKYILSVKPSLLNQGGSAEISLLSIRNDMIDINNITLFVLSPLGEKFLPSHLDTTTKNLIKMEFPTDFNNASSNLKGNYTIILASKIDNQQLANLHFLTTTNAVLSSFTNFVFNKGLAITFGIVGIIITIIYQIFSQRNQDVARRNENKANWMIENIKFHYFMNRDADEICKKFTGPLTGDEETAEEKLLNKLLEFDQVKIVLHTVLFYRKFMEFEKNAGTFYFDNIKSEQFMINLKNKIFKLLTQMIGSSLSSLKQFFPQEDPDSVSDLEKYIEDNNLRDNFEEYAQSASQWLSTINNAKTLFLSLHLFSQTLFVNVNKVILINYSKPSVIRMYVSEQMEREFNKPLLQPFIEELNREFYGNRAHLYYELFKKNRFNRKSKLDI